MAGLNNDHIDYIIKDLNYRGIVDDAIQNEILDHVCSAVEAEMKKGKRFIDAYHIILHSFGYNTGLRKIQSDTIHSKSKPTPRMFKNYITLAMRNFKKHRFLTLINISGLAVGIATCMVIVLFMVNEFSYDRYHTKADRIYRITHETKYGDTYSHSVRVPAPAAVALASEFPEVEAATHFLGGNLTFFVKRENEDNNIKVTNVVWSNNEAFKIFTVPFVEGSPEKALIEPNTAVISERLAQKLFANKSALNQNILLDNHQIVKVAGVYQNIPVNSHFHFEMILSEVETEFAKSSVWINNTFQPAYRFTTYVLLREGSNASTFKEKLSSLVKKYIEPQAVQLLGNNFSMEKFATEKNKIEYGIQPLIDIHLNSTLEGEFEPNFDISYIHLFSAIAFFILIIACINFMNLSTARSASRAKEVGMRKVMGSLRIHLIRQFLSESITLSFFAFIFALGITYICLPVFNNISNRQITVPWNEPVFYILFLGSALLVGTLAGLYPSFFLSAFKPVNTLKGKAGLGMKSSHLRSALVIFQFSISIILIIGTIVLFQQLNYIHKKDLGFNKEQIIMVEEGYLLGPAKQRKVFKDEILKHSVFTSGTLSGFLPAGGPWRFSKLFWPENKEATEETMILMQYWGIDHDYIKTLGMEIIEGRDFLIEFPSDTTGLILNEAAVKQLGLVGDPIGQKVTTFKGTNAREYNNSSLPETFTVLGVVKNFHFESLKKFIGPLAFHLNKGPEGSICLRFKTKDTKQVIDLVEKQWKGMAPGEPLVYEFMDEGYGLLYTAELQLGKIFTIFTGIAIIIACLGLFALSSFTAEQRTKEIGIRKALGASASSIVVLLSREFGKLILIAFAVAAPLAWYGINWWLKTYSYKVEIGIIVYLVAGLFVFAVAWITMSYQSIKAARNNPVTSLRSE